MEPAVSAGVASKVPARLVPTRLSRAAVEKIDRVQGGLILFFGRPANTSVQHCNHLYL